MIPYGKQEITQQDIDSVVNVLKSDFLTQGPQVPLFESKISDKVGVKHALAVNSATSALHIACLALGLKAGDILWTVPNTFVASANCALYCGARVDFVDINPHSYNICVDALEEKLKNARATGNLPKILVAVHLCGQSCDMEAINKLSVIYGFNVIEDASHAIGGKYKGENIGNCKYSDITVFSFHPVKIITTAEGGMALTNDDRLASMMNLLRSHGITRDENLMVGDSHGPWYYEQLELGFNYRMTELQAALGVSQLSRLDDFVAKRHDLAGQYNNSLADLPVILPWQDPDSYSSYHLYVIRIKTGETRKSHREIFECLRDQGIGVNLHYIPVYLHPYYRQMGYTQGYCIEAERYYSDAISIPLYPNLTKDNQLLVVNALRRACSS